MLYLLSISQIHGVPPPLLYYSRQVPFAALVPLIFSSSHSLGAFEISAHDHLMTFAKKVEGKAKIGVRAYAEALLVIPKVKHTRYVYTC